MAHPGEARPYGGRIGAVGLLATPIALLGPVPLEIAVDSVLGSDPLPAPMRPLVPEALQESTLALLLLAAGAARARLLAHVQRLSFGFPEPRGIASLQKRLASAQRAFELLDEVPEVAEHPQARPLPDPGRADQRG